MLSVVLSLQMSWAATHFCDDNVPSIAAHASDVAGADYDQADRSVTGKKSDSKKAEQLADCCSAAHGCHGLHHLLSPTEAPLFSVMSDEIVAPRDSSSKYGNVAPRVERPKWLAA